MRKIYCQWKPWRMRAAVALALLAIALIGGCNDGRPTRVPVSGLVLIDGKPLESGSIRLYPAHHRAASARIRSDGRFALSTYELGDGCVVGQHPVAIMGSKLLNKQTMRWFAPKKYASADTSGIVLDVTEPTDSIEIQLTWDGGKPFNERILGGGN
jgi:hypothetical protein